MRDIAILTSIGVVAGVAGVTLAPGLDGLAVSMLIALALTVVAVGAGWVEE